MIKTRRRGPHRKRGRFLILTLVTGVALLAMTEMILRFGLGLGNPVLIVSDAACGYILKPDQNVRRFFVQTRINHEGMRSDEVPEKRPPESLRLLFVGDSITYGTTRVDQSEIFTEVLHRELPVITHRPVEVLNASAGAWAIDNELSFLRSRGVFDSNMVLIVLNSGDLSQPRSTFDEVIKDLPSSRPLTAMGELLARYIRPRLLNFVQKVDAGDAAELNVGSVIARNLSDLDAAYEVIQRGKAQMVIVFIPFPRDIPRQSEASESLLRHWCADHRIVFLDMTVFEASYTASDITLDAGVHLNAQGNRIVARGIESAWPQLSVQGASIGHTLFGVDAYR